jgi:hypothetical protein
MTFVIASDSEAFSAIIREIASASQERWLCNDTKMDIRQGTPEGSSIRCEPQAAMER